MNATNQFGVEDPYINTTIPANISEIFRSATSRDGNTLTGAFDIQYRTWSMIPDISAASIDKGAAYSVGRFRSLGSLLMRNETLVLEGLIVDTVNGGVGFRNHTIPDGHAKGVRWQEDLTWVEPVTACIGTNLTMEFETGFETYTKMQAVRAIDDGGFFDMPREYPFYDLWPSQDIELWQRAYKGANIHNNYVMKTLGATRNSSAGKRFTLPVNYLLGSYDSLPQGLQTTKINGAMVQAKYDFAQNLTTSAGSNNSTITDNLFKEINLLCEGSGSGDNVNLTNILVKCGMVLAPPKPVRSGPDSFLFQANATYTRDVYVCASGMQASIKTVTFVMNGTSSLANLKVNKLEDKQYHSASAVPLWAIERLDSAIGDQHTLWGLVDNAHENNQKLETLRRERFWLPNTLSAYAGTPMDSLASSQAFATALDQAYNIDPISGRSEMDAMYSGKLNFGLLAMWQKLSARPQTASQIINLVATDVLASYVIGTKSAIMSSHAQGASDAPNVLAPVEVFGPSIKFDMLYAIPALLSLVLMAAAIIIAASLCALRRTSLSKVRQLSNQSCTGRAHTNVKHPDLCAPDAPTKVWIKKAGFVMITPLLGQEARNDIELKDNTSAVVSEPNDAFDGARVSPNSSQQQLRPYEYQTDDDSDVLEPPEADRP